MWPALCKGDCDGGGADGKRTMWGVFPSHTGIGWSTRKEYPSLHRWHGAVKLAPKERQGDNTAGA